MQLAPTTPFTRRVRITLAFAIAVLLLILLVLWVMSRRERAPASSGAIEARIELAAGNVSLERNGEKQHASSGTPLAPDSTISTGSAARALLRMQDGSAAFMRDATKVVLGARGLSLVAGELFINAAPAEQKALVHHSLDVRVSASDAGYSLARQGDTTTLTVTRGTVTLTAAGGRTEVQAGQQATVVSSGTPKTSPVAYFDDWTGGMADLPAHAASGGIGAGTIYGVDTNRIVGSVPQRLEIQKQAVRAVLRDELAETEVDQTFYNPGEHDVEGWYWFRIPEKASVTGFALETNGALIEGELIERKEAASKYTAAKSAAHSPAILEWVDERTVRARIHPIPSGGTRRVVVRYIELTPIVDGKISYVYPMGTGEGTRIGEFSLSVDLGARGRDMQIATLAEARIENGGERVTIRRSGYAPRAPFQLEATLKQARAPLSVARFMMAGESADYVLARFTPDVDWASARASRADVLVVVDTSGAGDESSRTLKVGVAEAILRALGGEDHFALMSLDVLPKVLFPANGLSQATPETISQALQRLAEHSSGGATDIGASFDIALERLHGTDQPAVVLISDGIPTSGELLPERLIERLRRSLETSRARFFTVGVGTEARPLLLQALAQVGGGQSILLGNKDEVTLRALELTAAIRTPTLTDLEIDLGAGLDDVVSNVTGKLTQGQEYLLLARTHHALPATAMVHARLAGNEIKKPYLVERDSGPLGRYAPRLWAAAQIRRLLANARNPEDQRGRVIALGLEYGLMTPFTSFLALESEAAYSEMGVARRSSPLRPPRLASLSGVAPAAANPGAILPLLTGCAQESAPTGETSESKAVSGQENQPTVNPALAPVPEPEVAAHPAKGAGPASPEADTETAFGIAPVRARIKSGSTAGESGMQPRLQKQDEPIDPVQVNRRFSAQGPPTRTAGNPPVAETKRALATNDTPPSTQTASSRVVLGTCSDLSRRALHERVVLWARRLRTAENAEDLIGRYTTAKRSCELTDWLAERTFLGLLESRLSNEGDTRAVLSHFSDQPGIRSFLASRLLRRSTDARIVATVREVLFGNAVDWLAVDRTIQSMADADKRIAELRSAIAKAPADPEGNLRLLREFMRAGRTPEAIALGQRIRDSGLLTPDLVRRIGDLLARDRQTEQAQRVYSELVEFAPADRNARQMLGDVYLARRWFDPAYRQYQLLTELSPEVSLFWLRLAIAAAGAGRTDEALRLERRVATAEGTPGPNDPRRFARLLATHQLATLLLETQKANSDGKLSARVDSISRELRELGLLSSPGRLVIATWLDPMADLLLTMLADKEAAGVGEATDAATVGLQAVWLSPSDATRARVHVVRRSSPGEYALDIELSLIDWDGKAFKIERRTLLLPAEATSVDG